MATFDTGGWKEYTITLLSAVLLTTGGFLTSGWTKFVTMDELNTRAPFVQARPVIEQHIKSSERVLDALNQSLRAQNEKYALEIAALKLHIADIKTEVKVNSTRLEFLEQNISSNRLRKPKLDKS